MPRLGTAAAGTPGNGGDGSPNRRRAVTAYPRLARGGFLTKVIALVFITFMLRNLFFKDYRKAEIERLRASGKTQEEIDKLVPQTASERRANKLNELKNKHTEYEKLVSEVEQLKERVKELQDHILVTKDGGEPATGSGNTHETKSDGATDTDVAADAKEEVAASKRRIEPTKKRQDLNHHKSHHEKNKDDLVEKKVTNLREKQARST